MELSIKYFDFLWNAFELNELFIGEERSRSLSGYVSESVFTTI
jgi:hypothetical protein